MYKLSRMTLERLRIAFTANARFAFMFSRKSEYMDENGPFYSCVLSVLAWIESEAGVTIQYNTIQYNTIQYNTIQYLFAIYRTFTAQDGK